MTKKQLEDLGLSKEQVDSIMKINQDDIEGVKTSSAAEIKNLSTEVTGLKAQVKERDTQLETLKASAGDNEALTKQIADLQAENVKAKETHEAELNQLKVDFAMCMDATTLNSAIQKACGDNKSKFSLVFCHSAVATNLENMNLIAYLKYTDAQGIQRDLGMATWNGRLVVVDDSMPVEVKNVGGTGGNVSLYTTYILGEGAIGFEDVGAKVPYEMVRDAKVHGGEDTLISRKRHAVRMNFMRLGESDGRRNGIGTKSREKSYGIHLFRHFNCHGDAKGER